MENTVRIALILMMIVFSCSCSATPSTASKEDRDQAVSESTIIEAKPEENQEVSSGYVQNNRMDEYSDYPDIVFRYSPLVLSVGNYPRDTIIENVSVSDAQDGEIHYREIGGIVGPQSDEFIWSIEHPVEHPDDNPSIVEAYGAPFWVAMGFNSADKDVQTVPINVTAYDSDGHITAKVFDVVYIRRDDNCTKKGTVNVEGLNVRSTPSTSGPIVGVTWKNASYQIFEETEADGYTWYRIAEDMWIADNGEWISFE